MARFEERIKELMKSAGLTDANMAFLLDISLQRLENILTGYSEVGVDVVKRVAEIFNVSVEYVLGLEETSQIGDGAKEIFVAESLDSVSGMIRLCDVNKTIYIDRADLHGKDYMGLIVKDDSMIKARIYKGDTVVVRRQQFANNGDVVAVSTEDGSYIVRRYQRVGNVVILTSEGDGMKYPPIKIDTAATKFNIIGAVTEVRITF